LQRHASTPDASSLSDGQESSGWHRVDSEQSESALDYVAFNGNLFRSESALEFTVLSSQAVQERQHLQLDALELLPHAQSAATTFRGTGVPEEKEEEAKFSSGLARYYCFVCFACWS